LKVRYSDFETVNRSSTAKESTNLMIPFSGLQSGYWIKPWGTSSNLSGSIGLRFHFSGGETQLSFFDAEAKRLEQLDRAIDQVRDKYGFDAIQTGYA
jgi:hypothetical protein